MKLVLLYGNPVMWHVVVADDETPSNVTVAVRVWLPQDNPPNLPHERVVPDTVPSLVLPLTENEHVGWSTLRTSADMPANTAFGDVIVTAA